MKKTGIILAGGRSYRFYPGDKCFITLDNKPLIKHVIDKISGMVDEIIVAARDKEQGEEIRKICDADAKPILVFDSRKDFGPLAGILSGLEKASFQYSLVIGCDMPHINEGVVEFLFEIAEAGGYDAVVPRWENGMLEALHSVYRNKQMLDATKKAVREKKNIILAPLSQLKKVKFVPTNKIKEIDPELKTFTNINTQEDLDRNEIHAKLKRSII